MALFSLNYGKEIKPEDMEFFVPFVPSWTDLAREALKISGIKPGEILWEPGCGDARVSCMAVEEFKADYSFGCEKYHSIFEEAQRKVVEKGLQSRVKIFNKDFFSPEIQFDNADVIYLYLFENVNEKLSKKFTNLKPGTRIVSIDYIIPGFSQFKIKSVHKPQFLWMHLYRM